jgi:hypothetical protein
MLPVLPHDKAMHVVYGAAAASAVLSLLVLRLPGWAAIAGAGAALIAVAIGKELVDRRSENHTADWKDAAATIFGGALVMVPACLGV